MIFLAKLGVGVLGTVLVAGAAVSSEGFVHVKVHEKQPDGANVNLFIPAALATTALHFVPNRDLRAHDSAQAAFVSTADRRCDSRSLRVSRWRAG